jgi:hypothetical protein
MSGPRNPDQSIQNNGEFSSLDVSDSSTGVDVDTVGEAIAVNASASEIVGSTYTTIQDAVNYFRGKTCSNCTITVAAGTYTENVTVSGVNIGGDANDLQILGDTRPIVGMTYIHSAYSIANLQGTITPATYPLATYGAGAITLSNTGASDVTVTCAGTAVDFGLAGVVAGDTCFVRNDAGARATYTVLSAVGPVVTMTTPIVGTTAATGSFITFAPNRKIYPSTGTSVTVKSNCTFKGFDLSAVSDGIWVNHADVYIDMLTSSSTAAGDSLKVDSGSHVNVDGDSTASSLSFWSGPNSIYVKESTVRLVTPTMIASGGANIFSSNVTLTSPVLSDCVITCQITSIVYITNAFMYAARNVGVTVSNGSCVTDVGSTYDMVSTVTDNRSIFVKNGGIFNSSDTVATKLTNARTGIFASGGAVVDSPLLLYNTVTTEFTWDASCSLRIMDSAGAGGAGAAAGFILQAPIATNKIIHHIVGNEVTSVLSSGGGGTYLTAQIAVAGAAAKQWNAPLTTLQTGFNMRCKGGRYDLAVVSSADSAATAQFGVGTVAALAANATLAAAATDADIVNELTTAGNVLIAGTTVTGAAHTDANVMLSAADVLYLNTASNWTIATNVNLTGSVTIYWTVVK